MTQTVTCESNRALINCIASNGIACAHNDTHTLLPHCQLLDHSIEEYCFTQLTNRLRVWFYLLLLLLGIHVENKYVRLSACRQPLLSCYLKICACVYGFSIFAHCNDHRTEHCWVYRNYYHRVSDWMWITIFFFKFKLW